MSLLLNLPDETLLNIAHRLRENDLKALSLSSRRLRVLVQECLFINGTIRPDRIFNVIDGIHRNPTLATLASHLHLGIVDEPTVKEMNEMLSIYKDMPSDGFQTCCDIVMAAVPNEIPTSWLFALREDPDFYSVGLSLLFAQLKMLDTISVDVSALYQIRLLMLMFYRQVPPPIPTLRIARRLTPQWILRVKSLIQGRLTALIVKDDQGTWESDTPSPNQGTATPTHHVSMWPNTYEYRLTTQDSNDRLDLSSFTCLQRLELPGHIIKSLNGNLWEVLPSSLETLIVHFGTKYEWIDFEWAHQLVVTWSPPKRLRVVELRFDLNLFSQTFKIRSRKDSQVHLSTLAATMEQSQIDFKTCFGHVKLAQLGDEPRIGQVMTWKPKDLVGAMDYFLKHKVTFSAEDEDVLEDWGFNH